MKKAILNIADVGALESTSHMLESVGYVVSRPGPELLEEIRWQARCEGVYSVEELVEDWGYAQPSVNALASPGDVKSCDLFVDVKAHVNYPRIVEYWPCLKGKVLWCCLNGGDPLKRTDGLPWVNPPCPVLTNNQWYTQTHRIGSQDCDHPLYAKALPVPWIGRAYACYPPYQRLEQRKRICASGPPICLVHNVGKWGYGNLVEPLKALGVRFYGIGDGNECVIPHTEAMLRLEQAVCMVHLKIGDTVGYATVEAMAASVPLVVTQQYIDETRLYRLLEPERTCLTFDPENAVETLSAVLDRLQNPVENQEIGGRGRLQLEEVQWNAYRDGPGFEDFLRRNFP
jgi:hypothetical protein